MEIVIAIIFWAVYIYALFQVPALAARQGRIRDGFDNAFWHFVPLLFTPIPPLLYLLLTRGFRGRRVGYTSEYNSGPNEHRLNDEGTEQDCHRPKYSPWNQEWNDWAGQAGEEEFHNTDLPYDKNSEQHYAKVLGLSGPTKVEDIRRAYRELAKQYHPDKVHNLGIKLRELADKEMKELNEAYDFFKKKYKL